MMISKIYYLSIAHQYPKFTLSYICCLTSWTSYFETFANFSKESWKFKLKKRIEKQVGREIFPVQVESLTADFFSRSQDCSYK